MPLFLLTSIVTAIMGIYQLFKYTNRKQSISILVLGIILFSSANGYSKAEEVEQIRIEQQEVEAQEEKERLAEEKKKQEIAKQKEQERIEKEKKLKEQILKALEKVEEEPTKANYGNTIALSDQLKDKDIDLIERLEKIKAVVDSNEKELSNAQKVLEEAEKDLDRDTYDKTHHLVAALSIPSRHLDDRLEKLDQAITKNEEEQLAKEKEAERIAAEKVEDERIAAEKVAQEKEQQQAPSNQSTTQSAPLVDNLEKVVYIAPQSGTKYHFSANYRGLNRANSIQEMSLTEAQNQGYDLCGFEK